MGRITNDLFDVTEFAHHCPEEFFIAGVKIIVSFIILATVNLPLTLIVFAVVPVMVFVCIKLNRRNKKAFAAQRVQIGELNARIEDSLLGQKVAKSLSRLSEGRTTITIAHRLSSIKNSDRILVLTEDGIVEEGNHEQLMAKKGIYYDFYTMADRIK